MADPAFVNPTLWKDPRFIKEFDAQSKPATNNELYQELQNRYGKNATWLQLGDRYKKDLGMGDYQVKIHPMKDPGESDKMKNFGSWSDLQLRGLVNPDLSEADKAETLVHEITHAKDYAKDPSFKSGEVAGHHNGYQFLEPQLAQSMAAQQAIETGLGIPDYIKDAYPHLSKVVPLSSQPLVTPDPNRAFKMSPETWNLIRKNMDQGSTTPE